MKTLKVILGIFSVTILFAFASGGDKAPQKVKDAFFKKFPTAKKSEMGKRKRYRMGS
ncbi:hypothetical protein [Algibacter lectus]|uniref:Uncharacterized protein n=1 Tax=Algibacter lectus TaxID=221126 RepID=A0A090VIM7_9FLAO|nr:hypothetical protein [Algibacter lectus]GAL64576.1 hypothetical protein JCM19300_148 [Algibacter lectus]